MTSFDLKTLFLSLQEQMTFELRTIRKGIPHPVSKGDASELNWIEWLRNYLPNRYSVDKAFIIDCNNVLSDQIDLVIYDQQYSPFVFNHSGIKYIPAESVYAVFEIKQELTKNYLEYASSKVESVRKLTRTSIPVPHAGGFHPPKTPHNILGGILTLSCDWKPPLDSSFEKCVSTLRGTKQINLGCVLEHGSFFIDHTNAEIIIKRSSSEETLIFFFLKLFRELQKIATVPAMDIEKYVQVLDSFKD